ncbi:MAG TPA: AzlC family ABC transporter permease [Stellaceae bacterium]|nr:AzlC family ABC transporter permease [Stellaceae bacterium]
MSDLRPRPRRSVGGGAGISENAIDRRAEFLRGLRVSLPLAAGVAAYGLVFGVLAREAGLSIADVALMSGIVFTGSAQFVALTLWAVTPPVLALAVTTLAVNLRYVLMAAALRDLFHQTPRVKALAAAFLVNDESWALTMGEVARGDASVGFMVGSSLALYVAWLGATVVGRVIGTAIGDPARWGIDFAFTATFLALLVGMVSGKRDILPWAVSAAAAIATSLYLPGKWYILIGGIAGATAGALRRDV